MATETTRTPSGTAELGFRSLEEETMVERLPLTGELPPWLGGALVRLSPAGLDVGERPVQHWFDGLAMLHRFAFRDGEVAYANRYLDTAARRAAMGEGEWAARGFAQDPCRTLFARFQSLFSAPKNDNANVNLVRLGERYLAMTEVPMPVEFDPATLATVGVERARSGRRADVTTAHPHHDSDRGELVNYGVRFGPRSTYRVTGRREGGKVREIGSTSVRRPSYMHSFAMTERYVVLVEWPLVVDPAALALSGKPFIENYRWRPELGTRFTAIDKATGEVRALGEAEAMFSFHHVNAFERGGELVIDFVAYDDAAVIEDLYLERLRAGATPDHRGYLRRCVVASGGGAVRTERLSDAPIELPRIDYARRNAREYRYAYGVALGPDELFPGLSKVDVSTGGAEHWREQGCHPGEPVFVRAPEARDEDDGLVLSVVLDTRAARSFLLVLDASSFEEVARAEAPHHIPFGFHGSHFSDA